MVKQTQLMIIGAGPYGLALAAYAKRMNLDYVVVGKSMSFWKHNMPQGMCLRSAFDWHIDPFGVQTITSYLRNQNLSPEEFEPIPRDLFLQYADSFQVENQIQVTPARISEIRRSGEMFEVVAETGEIFRAQNVVVAIGAAYFKYVPDQFRPLYESGLASHTCDYVDFESVRNKRCLIIGGRQSAFEWAALASERGAEIVHISHRHDTPEFKQSDWSWVRPLVDQTVTDPGWFRRMSSVEKERISRRFWEEGRLKLEPWLGPRIKTNAIKLWPNSQVTDFRQRSSGEIEIRLDTGTSFVVNQVLLATGYRVRIDNLPFLQKGSILSNLATRNGYPALDEHFQTSISRLFITSLPATQDFGPFFGFVIGAAASAIIIGSFLTQSDGGRLQV